MKTNQIRMYHNPNCSKSRAALALLEENGFSVEVIYYLEQAPNETEIANLAKQLGIPLRQMLRKNETVYQDFRLDDLQLADEIVLDIVAKHPILIERPIIQFGSKAIIGRPPESVVPFIKNELADKGAVNE
ncbi:MAG: arsenate reductase (glutaredoxin) [Pseudohongiellaceae bacterium]